jgi:hypothetical protein
LRLLSSYFTPLVAVQSFAQLVVYFLAEKLKQPEPKGPRCLEQSAPKMEQQAFWG